MASHAHDIKPWSARALEHDTYVCIHVGNTLRLLQKHVGNEAAEREAARKELTAEQADLLIRLADHYRINRERDLSHASAVSLCKRSLVYRQVCIALDDRVLEID